MREFLELLGRSFEARACIGEMLPCPPPDSRHFFIFALLRNAVPPTPVRAAELVADNRTLFERAVALDGKRYPFDSVPMTKHDWQKHYQPLWGSLR